MSSLPSARPRARWVVVAAVLLAVLTGLATGLAARPTLVVVAAVLSVVVLLPRVDLAALAVMTAAVFAEALDHVVPHAAGWLVAVLLLAWVVRRAAGPLHAHRTGVPLLPAGVFAAVLLLAAVAHPHGSDGLAVVGRYAVALAVFAVLVDVLAGPLEPRRAARAYVVACALAALSGLVAVLVGAQHRVAGPMGSPDDLGFFLVAAVPLVGTVARSRRAVLVCGAVLVAGVLGTGSRGAWVALAVVLVLAAATRVISLRYAGLALAVAVTGLAFVLAVLPHAVSSTLSDQQRYAETRLSQRAELWAAAAAITRDHPALGLGPGAFELFHADHRSDTADLVGRDLDVAHSTVLQASAELGVLGAATLLGVFTAPLLAVRRRWRRDRLTATAGLALSGLVVASTFETEQYQLPLWFLAALVSALAVRPRAGAPATLGLRSGVARSQ